MILISNLIPLYPRRSAWAESSSGNCTFFKLRNRYRAFDATMIYSKERQVIVDYLGTHQHLTVDIHCTVDDEGAMCIRSGEQRF